MKRLTTSHKKPLARKGQQGRKASVAQKRAIALGKVTGKTSKQVAQETGLADRTVRDLQTKDPRTLSMIEEFQDGSHRDFARMWLKAVKHVDNGLSSRAFDTRQQSAHMLLKLIRDPIGRKQAQVEASNADGDITLEELTIILRRATLKAG